MKNYLNILRFNILYEFFIKIKKKKKSIYNKNKRKSFFFFSVVWRIKTFIILLFIFIIYFNYLI